MIRPEARDFVSLGRLPSERGEPTQALEEAVERAGVLLDRIERPVTGNEAHALAECLGEDLCFGLAWDLLHLIETAPSARTNPPESARRWREEIANL